MEAPAEVGVAGKEQEDFAHEDPKMEKRSGWAPGTALDFQKPNCKQMEGLWGPQIQMGGGLGSKNKRPSEVGKVLQPLRRVAGKMVIITEARSWILKATPAENPGGVGGWGAGKRQGERSPSPAAAHPQPAPSTSPGLGEAIGPRADKRRVLPPNWVASEDPGATE